MGTETATATGQAPKLATGTWEIDSVHSRVGFEVKHLGISTFRGRFTGYEGRIVTSDHGLESVAGTIEASTVDVDDAQLAGHLGSEDFFAAEQYPQARFASTSVESAGEDRYRVVGDFTLRGVTRPVELDVTVEGVGIGPDGSDRISLAASGELDRTEYGISWNSKLANGASVVGERVRLVLSVEAGRTE
jgi:polyisoprenoid-binding protein YceI